jgi:hypothetical protein
MIYKFETLPTEHFQLQEQYLAFESLPERSKQLLCFLSKSTNTKSYDKPNPTLAEIEQNFPNSDDILQELLSLNMIEAKYHEVGSVVYPKYSQDSSFVECYPQSDYRMFLTLIEPLQLGLFEFLQNAKLLRFRTLFVYVAKQKLFEYKQYSGEDKAKFEPLVRELEGILEDETTHRMAECQENIQRDIGLIRSDTRYFGL